MIKFTSNIVPGIHDSKRGMDVFHVIILRHVLHDDQPRAADGYLVSDQTVVETWVAYSENAARLMGMEKSSALERAENAREAA